MHLIRTLKEIWRYFRSLEKVFIIAAITIPPYTFWNQFYYLRGTPRAGFFGIMATACVIGIFVGIFGLGLIALREIKKQEKLSGKKDT